MANPKVTLDNLLRFGPPDSNSLACIDALRYVQSPTGLPLELTLASNRFVAFTLHAQTIAAIKKDVLDDAWWATNSYATAAGYTKTLTSVILAIYSITPAGKTLTTADDLLTARLESIQNNWSKWVARIKTAYDNRDSVFNVLKSISAKEYDDLFEEVTIKRVLTSLAPDFFAVYKVLKAINDQAERSESAEKLRVTLREQVEALDQLLPKARATAALELQKAKDLNDIRGTVTQLCGANRPAVVGGSLP